MSNIIEQIDKAIGTLALIPAEVGVDNRCECSTWLYSLAGTPVSTDSSYKEIFELHKAFHKVAATVVTKVQAGDKTGAETLNRAERR